MDYTLAILTHGKGRTLDQTLASFYDKVKPRPSHVIVHMDGRGGNVPALTAAGPGADVHIGSEQKGFCHATGHLWRWASQADTEFVFWLEHDFVFLRPVDLDPLADVLRADSKLCQMQLMRTAVSAEEISAGGLFESRLGEYERVTPLIGDELHHWMRHRSYLTTNPSLMRTAWMAGNQWPDDDEPHCEGRFGIDVVNRGFYFGVWGCGEPWVEHIGHRTGFGY